MKDKGVPLDVARKGAGLYQTRQDIRNGQAGTSIKRHLLNPSGFGDDPRDTQAIEHGYRRHSETQ